MCRTYDWKYINNKFELYFFLKWGPLTFNWVIKLSLDLIFYSQSLFLKCLHYNSWTINYRRHTVTKKWSLKSIIFPFSTNSRRGTLILKNIRMKVFICFTLCCPRVLKCLHVYCIHTVSFVVTEYPLFLEGKSLFQRFLFMVMRLSSHQCSQKERQNGKSKKSRTRFSSQGQANNYLTSFNRAHLPNFPLPPSII